jgi:hypothetical protein
MGRPPGSKNKPKTAQQIVKKKVGRPPAKHPTKVTVLSKKDEQKVKIRKVIKQVAAVKRREIQDEEKSGPTYIAADMKALGLAGSHWLFRFAQNLYGVLPEDIKWRYYREAQAQEITEDEYLIRKILTQLKVNDKYIDATLTKAKNQEVKSSQLYHKLKR